MIRLPVGLAWRAWAPAAVVVSGMTLGLLLGGDRPGRILLSALGAGLALLVVLMERSLRGADPRLVAGRTFGLAVGLGVALLARWAAAPALAGLGVSPGLTAGLLAVFGAYLGACTGPALLAALPRPATGVPASQGEVERSALPPPVVQPKVIDTSVIIDGRIADVITSGFLEGPLIVPQFILRELQQVADSADPLKRARGRKGLDVLQAMRDSERIEVIVSDTDYADVREVDGKLIALAEDLAAKVLTNDYNLNKVAQLRGVAVLNVNDLANAVKPVVLPGENLSIQIIKEGKERNQGVGYLDDGTMVVVDNARERLGDRLDVIVTSVIQTNAGKMIFSAIDEGDPTVGHPKVARRDEQASPPPVASRGS